jgi:farnesyl diphosphate synthase
MPFVPFQKQVHQRVDQLLAEQIQALPAHAETLKQAMHYALLMGGKRMRPFLLYATGDMLGAKQQDLDVPALALEAIHAYSLVHDDLPAMDDDELRRGNPTCHIKFDEASAILAGDALQTLAFEMLANLPLSVQAEGKRIALIRTLSHAAGYQGMCGGQAMDLAATDHTISQSQLESLHHKKTGALLVAAVDMAAELAPKLAPGIKSKLLDYAQTIGLAFQVQDDILDVVGDSLTLGKPQGSDQENNKSTYPAMLGLEGAQAYLKQLHQQALQALRSLPYNTQVLESFTDFIIQRNH